MLNQNYQSSQYGYPSQGMSGIRGNRGPGSNGGGLPPSYSGQQMAYPQYGYGNGNSGPDSNGYGTIGYPSQNPYTSQAPMYAHGGRTKRGKMVLAHMQPQELDVMDHLQGKRERCPRTNIRSYSHLEEIFKNPHILRGITHHTLKRAHHDAGNAVHGMLPATAARMAHHGIHGDTQLALIGPHTNRIFHQLTRATGGHCDMNADGHPQYFGLSNIFGGIKDFFTGIPGAVSNLWNNNKDALISGTAALGQQGLNHLGERYGGEMGKNMANTFGNAANRYITSNISPEEQERGKGWANQAVDTGRNIHNAYKENGIHGAIGEGVQEGGRYIGGGAGDIMGGIGQGIRDKQAPWQIAKGAAQQAAPYALQAAQNYLAPRPQQQQWPQQQLLPPPEQYQQPMMDEWQDEGSYGPQAGYGYA
jgi:hypothetical protein